jgi:hypothetical protein
VNIYTYYQDVNFSNQQELIDLWKFSWSRQGFNPIVLTSKDALNADIHDEYIDFVTRVHKKIGSKIEGYYMAAQKEIAAFTTINEPSFVSDYDVMNINFSPPDYVDNLVHWRDGRCTCFASGGSSGWRDYIKFLYKNEEKITNGCNKIKLKTGREQFHDQDFLVHTKVSPNMKEKIKDIPFLAYRDENSPATLKQEHLNSVDLPKIIHVSHDCTSLINIENQNIEDIEDKRVYVAKKVLNLL